MSSPLVVIFVRHSAGCKYEGDATARRCDCNKWLRWTHNGKQFRETAGTRSWAAAEEKKRALEDRLAGRTPVPHAEARDIRGCIDVFLQDKRVQGISADALAKYERELGRLSAFCERTKVYNVESITREVLTGYCATWDIYPSTQTRSIVRGKMPSVSPLLLRSAVDAPYPIDA